MGDIIFKYSSIEEAINAYNGFVTELETTINDYENKTAGIASNGESWGGNAATVSAEVIAIIRSWIQQLKDVTHSDSEKINTAKNNNIESENEIKSLYEVA